MLLPANLWCEVPQAIVGEANNCLRQLLAKPTIAQMKKEEKDEFNCQFDLKVQEKGSKRLQRTLSTMNCPQNDKRIVLTMHLLHMQNLT